MLNIIYSLIAGVVQGLTEFLPVSSSGHLLVLHDFLKFDFVDNLAFDVVLHWGTLLALIIFFRKDLVRYVLAFFGSFRHWNIKENLDQRLAWYLALATIPAGLAGLLWENQIETVLRASWLVAVMLILFGLFLYLADVIFSKSKEIRQLGWVGALIIGVAQALALIPGVSRSGATIIAGLSQKLKRDQAARFSFLLSVPIVFLAGLKKIVDLISVDALMSGDWLILAVGFFASFISGYFCIKYFLRFLQSHSLKIFAYYRIIFGIIILLVLYFG